MRARLVRPAFWSDSKVARLAPATRLFYIGLWCVADDAGYIEWDLPEICAQLAPYAADEEREEAAAEATAQLVAIGRVKLLDCGRHAVIPTLERHRIAGGNTSRAIAQRHRDEGKSGPVRTDTEKSRSESPSESESLSPSPRASAQGQSPGDEELKVGTPPMSRERAQAILDDAGASPEAQAGARGYLELARAWGGRPRRGATA